MNFIRDNIIKIIAFLVVAIIVIVVVVSCSNRTPVDQVVGGSKYVELENRLQNAAIKYVNKNKSLLPKTTEKNTKIMSDTLIKNKYMREMYSIEDGSVKCSGYVDISKTSEEEADYRYTPHIKCGKYYETKSIATYILDNDEVVTEGDGLYQGTESYYYRGENPNNYILLDDYLFRILEVTDDNYLKVISTKSTSYSYIWDNRYNIERNDYSGINIFERSRMKDNLDFVFNNTDEKEGEVYFTPKLRSYVVEHDFCADKRSISDTSFSSKGNCNNSVLLKIGLINLNEYYRASISSDCKTTSDLSCNNYNYLFNLKGNYSSVRFVTLTVPTENSYSYFYINNGELGTQRTNRGSKIYPTFYINDDLLYYSGDGSYDNPYVIR